MTNKIDSTSIKPKTNRGLKTKQKLFEAAEIVFGEKGYHQAGITDITQQAKVSLGTFYTYFQSKEEIYRELVLNMQWLIRKEIKMGTEGITNRLELEKEGFKIYFKFLRKHRYYYRLFRQAEFVDDKLFRQYFESLTEGYIKGLTESMAQGEIRKLNPEMLVYCLMGITDFVGMKWVLWDEKEIGDEFIEELMSFIQYGMANSSCAQENYSKQKEVDSN